MDDLTLARTPQEAIRQSEQEIHAGERGADEQHADAPLPDPTLETLPLTPAMTAALTRTRTRNRVIFALIGGICLLVCAGVAVYFYPKGTVACSVAGAFVVAITLVTGIWADRVSAREAAAGTYLRVTGMIHGEHIVDSDGDTSSKESYLVVVGLRRYPTWSEKVVKQVREPAWRSADMSRYTTMIFEVRDAEGTVICRDPRYRPDETA